MTASPPRSYALAGLERSSAHGRLIRGRKRTFARATQRSRPRAQPARRNTPRPPRLEAAYGLGRPRPLYRQEGHRHRMSDPLDLAGPGRVLRPPFMPTSHGSTPCGRLDVPREEDVVVQHVHRPVDEPDAVGDGGDPEGTDGLGAPSDDGRCDTYDQPVDHAGIQER